MAATARSNGKSGRSLAVRKAAANTAVKASEKTGRPVDPRVRALADAVTPKSR
ncbi:hypothetical protein ONA92_27035 [Mycobacteroides salmoniphilum]|uniref:hypothetical protein n=1 Tax=Mycobacteroides salmoniphilum TaxID=404941 RepID=UPI00356900FD